MIVAPVAGLNHSTVNVLALDIADRFTVNGPPERAKRDTPHRRIACLQGTFLWMKDRYAEWCGPDPACVSISRCSRGSF